MYKQFIFAGEKSQKSAILEKPESEKSFVNVRSPMKRHMHLRMFGEAVRAKINTFGKRQVRERKYRAAILAALATQNMSKEAKSTDLEVRKIAKL